jgi:pimeloyl-ACP methyl ester carboxylesterase
MFQLYWMIGEILFIILFFSFILFKLWRKIKSQTGKIDIPQTINGKIIHYTKRLLRLLGFGFGALLVLILIISIERTYLSVITETTPAPSEVTIPDTLGFEVEEVTFESEDGITLAGWLTPSQNGATVILLHGYGGNRTGMIWHAQQLTKAGYGVLMYDERASGESTGAYRSYGWEDHLDVKAAIRFIHSQNPDEHIGAVGCSTGASIVVYSAALYPEVEAAWGDGNSSVRAQDLPAMKNPLMAIIIANNYLIDWLYTVRLGIEAPAPLTDILPNIAPRPAMFVGGGMKRPLLGSEEDLYTLRFAEIAGPNAQAWVIDEAIHCDGPFQIPEEYSQKMVAFFDEAFGIER